MYLHHLNNEEKTAYLKLMINAAKVNGVIADEEKACIESYCREMGISPIENLAFSDNLQAELEDVFSRSSKEHKRIILFESIAFMFVDGTYDKAEEHYILDFSEKLGITKDELFEIEELVKKYVFCVTDITEKLFT